MPQAVTVRDSIVAHPRLAAFFAGALGATGFQPLGLWPLTLIALAVLFALIVRAPDWKAATWAGWAFGVGHFTLGNNWIATAFSYQANMPAWLGWIAVFALALYLAVFPALATATAWRLARAGRLGCDGPNNGAALVLAFAATWIIAEWLRSWVFTGFAWNPLGVALLGGYASPGLAFVAPWIGTYGLSGLAVALGGIIWRLSVSPAGLKLPAAMLILVVVAAMFIPARPLPEARERLGFTLVQPDIRQEVLNDPAWFDANHRKLAGLSLPRVPGERRLVLWPESGVSDYLRDGYPGYLYEGSNFGGDPALARARLARAIGRGAMLLTGAVDLEIAGDDVAGARNVVTAIDDRGEIAGSYAKAHLVPYGEYLALRWLLEPLGASRLVPGGIDFLPGPGPRTLALGDYGRVGVQICYEIIFSGQVTDRADRPDFLFNPTNDGWFGSWGPPQHLAQARLRAIEEGLPVLRATTTGISAVIDADGVVRSHIPHHRAGRIDGQIPAAMPPTLFARWGNILPLLVAFALIVASLVASRRRNR